VHRRALVRRPSPRLAEGLITHITRTPVDPALARQQWEGYVAALRAEGWETVEVPPADDCPDSVFVEDTVVVYGGLAVIARPGADERKPETAGTEETLAALGSPARSTAATSSSTTARCGWASAAARTGPAWSSSGHCWRRWALGWWGCP
jgi:N-dimethylarginine dimethylaminohydrolase